MQHKTSKVNLSLLLFTPLNPSNAGANFYPCSSSAVQKTSIEQQQKTATCKAAGKDKRNNDIITNITFRVTASQEHVEFIVFTAHYCNTWV